MRSHLVALATFALVLQVSILARPVAASTGPFFFHGLPTDNVDKQCALTDDTCVSHATFSTSAPTSLTPIDQTTTGVANQDFVGNPLTAYWHGAFTGTVSGQLQLDWWWVVPSPGTSVAITVFADPVYASSRVQPDRVIGRGVVSLPAAPNPTEVHSAIFVNGTVTKELLIQVAAASLVTGNGIQVLYDSLSTQSNFRFVDMPVPTTPNIVFDTTNTLSFAPSTTVSAHFLGAEPQTTIERRVSGSQAGRVDPQRIFVDWPLSSRTQIGQLSRSVDGGDSFRLLYDRTCAPRSRPTCQTGGGGDTEDEVNLVNGDVFFADQEVVANEAVASSTDHGDTWPALRQFAISNTGTAVDRQWLAWSDPSLRSIAGQPVEAFFSYHVPAVSVHVLAILANGVPVAQPVPQLIDVSQSGNLRVDNSSGRARGWIYVPYRNGAGFQVASARVDAYELPTSWQSNLVTTDTPAIFPWLNLDAAGNAYAVWVTSGIVYLSVSPIADARNDPTRGGRPATFWTPKARVSLPAVGSAVFPAVTAGSAGRIAVAYMGSPDCSGASDGCPDTAHWNTYVALLTDALSLTRGGPTTVITGLVNHRVVHRGQVCTSGTTCSGDRSLLDMLDLGFDESGRVGVVFMDNNNGLAAEPRTTRSKAGPFTQFAKLTAGPSLIAPSGTGTGSIAVSIPENGRADPAGDATWPNTAAGANLPALDLLGAAVSVSGPDLVARLPLTDATRSGMARDLAAYNAVPQLNPAASRLQYVFRFSTDEDVWHLSMEFNADGTVRFFGGKLGANDGLTNGTSVLGSGYHTDAAVPVVGSLRRGAITLRAPLSALGLSLGSRITGAAAFSMAGPSEGTEAFITNPMRTIDATPPFDATLASAASSNTDIDCTDSDIETSGGWHVLSDSRAGNGTLCRNVGNGSNDRFMDFGFSGTGVDVIVANGPRGGDFALTIDGTTQIVDLFRAPADPAQPDGSGRRDLTFGVAIHRDLPAGEHSLRIDVRNDSGVAQRNMNYVDGFTIYGGDLLTASGHTTSDASSTVVATAVAGAEVANQLVLDPAAEVLDAVVETVPGVTVTLTSPTGTVLATASVDPNGVVDVHALPVGPGAYVLIVHNGTAGAAAFTVFEAITELR